MMTRKRGSASSAKANAISLIMESGNSPLSDVQLSAKSKAEEEYQQFMKKLNETITKRNGEIVESGTYVTVYEIDCTPKLVSVYIFRVYCQFCCTNSKCFSFPTQIISKDITGVKSAQGSTILTTSQASVQSLIPNQSVLLPVIIQFCFVLI